MLITSVYMKIPILLYLRKNHMTFLLYRKIWSDFTKPCLAFKQHTKTSDSLTHNCPVFSFCTYYYTLFTAEKNSSYYTKKGILDSNVLI